MLQKWYNDIKFAYYTPGFYFVKENDCWKYIDLAENILNDSGYRKSLNALSTPRRVDLARMSAPKVSGIVLEEHRIKLFTEAVDIEILKRIFLTLENCRFEIAENDDDIVPKTHIHKGFPFERYGVIEELLIEEYA